MPNTCSILPDTASNVSYGLHWKLIVLCALLNGLIGLVNADVDLPPLAQCRLQQTPGTAASTEMQPGAMLSATQRPAAVITANYRQGPSGDWEVAGDVDGRNTLVRLLLLTPNGPILIDLSLLVDDESFRATRERWIDDALAGEQRIDEADKPAPSENAADEKDLKSDDQAPKSGEGSESEDQEESDETSESDESESEEVVTTTSAQIFELDGALTRLQKYAAQPGIELGRDEARWLLAQWSPGAELLELRPSFAAERSQLAPLWAALDKDGNNTLSAEEVESSVTNLRALDSDEDDWVDESEMLDGVSRIATSWTSFPLITVINNTTDWNQLARQLRVFSKGDVALNKHSLMHRLLRNLNVPEGSQITASHLSRLAEIPSDLTIRADFGTEPETATGLFVTGMADTLLPQDNSLSATEDVLILNLSNCIIELSAAQPPASSTWSGQVALGAVIDGSPLLRMVDEDNDRRLSLREIEAVTPILLNLDRNNDSSLELDEVPVPIRLTVTQGPYAHDILKQATIAPRRKQATDAPPAPEWFASMDSNKDNELTVAEFLGTQKQFNKLDADGNQRISSKEAVEFD